MISFHNYSWPEDFEKRVEGLESYHRPILCTEYMARPMGSTFDLILPIAKKHHVAAINWGLVAGKTQTYLPWDSWEKPYVLQKPPVWFHEVFYPDGKPYREREAQIIRELTGVIAGWTVVWVGHSCPTPLTLGLTSFCCGLVGSPRLNSKAKSKASDMSVRPTSRSGSHFFLLTHTSF